MAHQKTIILKHSEIDQSLTPACLPPPLLHSMLVRWMLFYLYLQLHFAIQWLITKLMVNVHSTLLRCLPMGATRCHLKLSFYGTKLMLSNWRVKRANNSAFGRIFKRNMLPVFFKCSFFRRL